MKSDHRVSIYGALFVRAGARFAQRLQQTAGDDKALQRKVVVQLIAIRKMWRRALADSYNQALDTKRVVERKRRMLGDPRYKHREYKKLVRSMEPIQRHIEDSDKWIVDTLAELQRNGLALTQNELQTALSVSSVDAAQGIAEWRW